MIFDNHPDFSLVTKKKNREKVKYPKQDGKMWCSKCDHEVVFLGEKCSKCGFKIDKKLTPRKRK